MAEVYLVLRVARMMVMWGWVEVRRDDFGS
jgi:hypothetical protein